MDNKSTEEINGQTITLTIGQLILIVPSLNKLMDIQLPLNISFKLARIYRQIEKDFQEVENIRKNLIKKYGDYNKELDTWSLNENHKNWSYFKEEYEKVINQKITILSSPISINEIESKIEIEPSVLINLIDIIITK